MALNHLAASTASGARSRKEYGKERWPKAARHDHRHESLASKETDVASSGAIRLRA